jgi:carbamoyltransferase
MLILGLNAYHADSAAAIIKDGKLIAAIEEERLNRIKHWSGFPYLSIKFCLEKANASLQNIDYIVLNRDSRANLHKKIFFTLTRLPSLNLIKDRFANMRKVADISKTLADAFGVEENMIKARISTVEHHRAHLASAYFASEFKQAAVVSVDGFGDFTSVMVAKGQDNAIKPAYQINYPHSLGIFYSAFTQLLGFPRYGDEYKIMGLSGFGKPAFLDKVQKTIQLKPKGRFALNLKYFQHYLNIDRMEWHNTAPDFGKLYSDKIYELFDKAKLQDTKITDYQKNIAASVQAVYEKTLFHILNYAFKITGYPNLCLAGGCAMNSLANGKIFDNTPFKDVYIPAGAYDAGGAIGAAYYFLRQVLNKPGNFAIKTSNWGPEYTNDNITELLDRTYADLKGMQINKFDDSKKLTCQTAKYLAEGKIVGWFQGRMEWGARALGYRSILADPRKENMRDTINSKIKFRESFRPFAPSVLQEHTAEYFECDYPAPFMQMVYPIKQQKRSTIPAVTHVDGTGRLQTVSRKESPLYWQLINDFKQITGVPILLNTSFNENEPIVCNPKEALDCFLRTDMDILVLNNYLITR